MKLRKGVKRAAGFDKAALGRLRHPNDMQYDDQAPRRLRKSTNLRITA